TRGRIRDRPSRARGSSVRRDRTIHAVAGRRVTPAGGGGARARAIGRVFGPLMLGLSTRMVIAFLITARAVRFATLLLLCSGGDPRRLTHSFVNGGGDPGIVHRVLLSDVHRY